MARKGGGEGRYQSLKTGKFVSAYYGKRHPETCVKVDDPSREAAVPKEPTKRELLERIERLEKQVDELRMSQAIYHKDGSAIQKLFMESLEKGQRGRQAAGRG